MRIMNFVKKYFFPFLLSISVGLVVFLLISISNENRRLNEQSLTHNKCLASVFASFTQTGKPVTIEDLDICKVRQADGTVVNVPNVVTPSASPTPSSTVRQTTPKQNAPTPQPVTQNPSPTPTQPATPPTTQPTPPEPKPVEILGVPACVPLTGVCVNQ